MAYVCASVDLELERFRVQRRDGTRREELGKLAWRRAGMQHEPPSAERLPGHTRTRRDLEVLEKSTLFW